MSVSTRTSASRRGSPAEPAAGAGSLPIAGVTAAPRARPGRGRSWRHTGWLRLVSPIVVLALWQIISVTGIVSQQKLPSLTTLWSTAVRLITTTSPTYGTLQGAMAISLERVAIGFAIGGSLAVILAVIAGLSRFGENAVDPVMQALRTLPLFGLIPVFIVWFGIGETPKITLIALGAAIPLYLNNVLTWDTSARPEWRLREWRPPERWPRRAGSAVRSPVTSSSTTSIWRSGAASSWP